jgi:hypothetical protein
MVHTIAEPASAMSMSRGAGFADMISRSRRIAVGVVILLSYASCALAEQRWSVTLAAGAVRDGSISGTQVAGEFGVGFAPVPAFSLGLEVFSGPSEFRTASGPARGSIGTLMIKAAARPTGLHWVGETRPFAAAGIGWLNSYATRGDVTVLARDSLCASVGVGLEGHVSGRTGWLFEVDHVFESGSTTGSGDLSSQRFGLWRLKAGATIRFGRR